MSNRVGGDFNSDAVEVFRAAYAAQLMTPQEQDVDTLTGLPTDTISNTSPWIESTGLWKYPSGKGPEEDLRAPFNPEAYYTPEEEEEEEGELEEIDINDLSQEEFDALLETLDVDELEALSEHLGEQLESEEQEDEGLTDEEIDTLLNELLGDIEEGENPG